MTLDTTSHLLFGEPIGALTDPTSNIDINALKMYNWRTGISLQWPRLSIPLEVAAYIKNWTERKEFRDWNMSRTESVLSDCKGRFKIFTEARTPHDGLPIPEMEQRVEALFLTWAGISLDSAS